MEISYVADTFDLTVQLIPGLLDHWRPYVPEDTWESRVRKLQSHMNRNELPIAWLAHDGSRALGTAALRSYDLPGRQDLSPWLGGVYVAPQFRKRGIGSSLCRVVEMRAFEFGFQRLYLFTLDQQALYSRLGWRTFDSSSWNGHAGNIMTKELVPG
jgi:N-acetylglutamate synthase-like GNAT family acetyltransferase